MAILLISIAFVACSPTKYVEKGEYVVDKVVIESDNNRISKSKLKSVVQPQPLKKLVGVYSFRARIYNIPNPKKDGKRNAKKQKKLERINKRRDTRFDKETQKILSKRNIQINKSERLLLEGDTIGYLNAKKEAEILTEKWNFRKIHAPEMKNENKKKDVFAVYEFLRRIGQKPELFDTMLVNYSTRQIGVYLKNQGYFNSKVDTTFKFKKKRVKITYTIKSGKPLKISSVAYNFPDSAIEMQNFFIKEDYKFKPGKNFDVGELENFRTNLATKFRDNGFYYFSKQLISYKLDTIGKYENATLFVNFNNNINKKVYEKWKIRDIYIHSDYDANLALQDPGAYYNHLDTAEISRDLFIYNQIQFKQQVVKPRLILNEIYIYPDSLYKLKYTKSTYSHLSKFKIYKLTNIQFQEVTNDSTGNYLDCDIQLTPDKKKSIIFDLESTNTSVSVGAAGNTMFSHKNLFHGGEVLDVKLQLALEKQKTQDSTAKFFSFNTQEYTFDMKLTVPRVLVPQKIISIFKNSYFIQQNNPKTIISTLFSYQNRPEYNKIQAVLGYEYYLKSSDFSSHIITPARISSIRVPKMDPDFQEWVNKAMLQESYEDHFIIGSKYSYTFSNQGTKGNNFYLQTNLSWAGNVLYALSKPFNLDTLGNAYILPVVQTPYAQYVKADFDFRYYFKTPDENQLIWRIFTGVAVPYGNSNLLPFGEKYFVGGANSIRAWQARSLGPGEYTQPDGYNFSNQTGDIKLELNLEYRFNVVNFLEGAVFIDAGNIWAINSYDSRIGGIFFVDDFYKQIAIGTGFGLRLNFNFFVFRTDIGIKVVDPAAAEGQRLIPLFRNYDLNNDFTINIAIGYPF
ncbi:MAG: BamA/TamA family outer membrane protein [Bacteroidales bacterium]|nr:BamA/TamA family outer membrane protein [Bacteroidales bacterium]